MPSQVCLYVYTFPFLDPFAASLCLPIHLSFLCFIIDPLPCPILFIFFFFFSLSHSLSPTHTCTDAGSAAFAKLALENTYIQTLDLSKNSIRAPGVSALATAIEVLYLSIHAYICVSIYLFHFYRLVFFGPLLLFSHLFCINTCWTYYVYIQAGCALSSLLLDDNSLLDLDITDLCKALKVRLCMTSLLHC